LQRTNDGEEIHRALVAQRVICVQRGHAHNPSAPVYPTTTKVSICAATMVNVALSSADDAHSIARAPATRSEPTGESVTSLEKRETIGRGGGQADGENSGTTAGSEAVPTGEHQNMWARRGNRARGERWKSGLPWHPHFSPTLHLCTPWLQNWNRRLWRPLYASKGRV
jgi:hypothetical protein